MKRKTIDLFKKIAKNALQPVPQITVSEWADKYRVLSAEASAEAGRWRTDRAPYQREIMDAFTQSGINKVVVKSASQIGKSDIMNNVIARFAHIDPGPIMLVQPTIEQAQDYSKSRIAPMIRDTKVLSNIFKTPKSRISNNTILSKLFPGGRLIIGGANSPSGLASKPMRILLADEIDRFPRSAGTEGDPLALAQKRQTTFWNKVLGIFSTPTNFEGSRIEEEYLTGTQEEWQHKCPNCSEYHLITHRNMHLDYEHSTDFKGKKHIIVKDVQFICSDCGFTFSESAMKSAEQTYIAQNAAALSKGVRSFFINCFASPWLSWVQVMQEWLEAKGDTEQEKVIINTRFGETFEPKGNFDSIDEFIARQEKYNADLPEGVLLLTAAVDVQDNRLEYEVCGWGEGEECWGIYKGVIYGVPDTQEIWTELDKHLDRQYKFADGTGLLVARTFIDTGGHYTKESYNYCLKNYAKQRFAIKGSSIAGVPLVYKYAKAEVKTGRKKYTIPLVLIGTDSGKQYVMDRLAIKVPGTKYFHFPVEDDTHRGYTQIYFKGLVAEQLVPRKKNGRLVMVWDNVAKDKRNEPLDLRVYNLACLHSINPDFDRIKQALKGNAFPLAQKPQKQVAKKRSFGSGRKYGD